MASINYSIHYVLIDHLKKFIQEPFEEHKEKPTIGPSTPWLPIYANDAVIFPDSQLRLQKLLDTMHNL